MIDQQKLKVGDKVHFEGDCKPYVVQACDERFVICTRPYATRKTVFYTIIDLEQEVRGTENLVFGVGAETREQCEAMLARLNGTDPESDMATEVSHRNRVALDIVSVVRR